MKTSHVSAMLLLWLVLILLSSTALSAAAMQAGTIRSLSADPAVKNTRTTDDSPPTSTPTPAPTRKIRLPDVLGTPMVFEPVDPTPTRRARLDLGDIVNGQPGVIAPECGNQAALTSSPGAEVVVPPNMPAAVTVLLKNTGSCSWGPAYSLTFQGKEDIGANPLAIAAPNTLPQSMAGFVLNLQAPAGGTHVGVWQMKAPDGRLFGPLVYVVVHVAA